MPLLARTRDIGTGEERLWLLSEGPDWKVVTPIPGTGGASVEVDEPEGGSGQQLNIRYLEPRENGEIAQCANCGHRLMEILDANEQPRDGSIPICALGCHAGLVWRKPGMAWVAPGEQGNRYGKLREDMETFHDIIRGLEVSGQQERATKLRGIIERRFPS